MKPSNTIKAKTQIRAWTCDCRPDADNPSQLISPYKIHTEDMRRCHSCAKEPSKERFLPDADQKAYRRLVPFGNPHNYAPYGFKEVSAEYFTKNAHNYVNIGQPKLILNNKQYRYDHTGKLGDYPTRLTVMYGKGYSGVAMGEGPPGPHGKSRLRYFLFRVCKHLHKEIFNPGASTTGWSTHTCKNCGYSEILPNPG